MKEKRRCRICDKIFPVDGYANNDYGVGDIYCSVECAEEALITYSPPPTQPLGEGW